MNLQKLFFPYDDRPEHHKPLDGLRGWAVLLVLLGHATNQGLSPWLEGTLLSRGKLGVYLFFVLSAYLLDRQIIQVWQQGKGNASYWRYYASRRILRIFPPFVLALLVFRFMNEAGYKVVMHEWSHVWEHLLLHRGDHIFWSIPTEFVYYFISPIFLLYCSLFFKLDVRRSALFFVAVVLASVAINSMYELPRFNTLRYIGIFSMGTLVAVFQTLAGERFNSFVAQRWMRVLPWAAWVVLVGWGFVAADFTSQPVYIPAAVLWSLLLIASFGQGAWSRILSWKAFRFIGTISYSLYLFHIPVLVWVKTLNMGTLAQLVLFLILSVAVASLSHLLIERPALRLATRRP